MEVAWGKLVVVISTGAIIYCYMSLCCTLPQCCSVANVGTMGQFDKNNEAQ